MTFKKMFSLFTGVVTVIVFLSRRVDMIACLISGVAVPVNANSWASGKIDLNWYSSANWGRKSCDHITEQWASSTIMQLMVSWKLAFFKS